MSVDRIGGILAKLAIAEAPGTTFQENLRCGGALLYVTRVQAVGLGEKGFRWKNDPERLPDEGRHMFRVACSSDVQQLRRPPELPPDASDEDKARAALVTETYGLCTRCSGYEMGMRRKLKAEAKAAEENAKGQGRKRRFSEDAAE